MSPVGITTAVESPGIGIGNTSGIVKSIKEVGSDLGPSSLTMSSTVRDLRDSSSNNLRRISDVRGVVRSRFPVFNRAAVRFCLVAPVRLLRARLFVSGRSKPKSAPTGAAMLAVIVVFIVRWLEGCQEEEPGARRVGVSSALIVLVLVVVLVLEMDLRAVST